MKIIKEVLEKFISPSDNIVELTNNYITEVESFGDFLDIKGLVIGHVLECHKHPNSDHLSLTIVDLGRSQEQIVCGASNVRKGQYVVVATIGTVLPGNFLIKKSTIRGVESAGMICSLKELGILEKFIPEKFKNGIYYFDSPKEVGKDALKELSLGGWVLELSLTPNRGDLLSHLGFSYDLAAVTGKKVVLDDLKIPETALQNDLKIVINTDNCEAYFARKMTVKIMESPWWIKSALIKSGIRPINNVVDITNYVLIELGTPLHAFDSSTFQSNEIVIRNSALNEEIVTLDLVKRKLSNSDVVITNNNNIMALGGVMGSFESMVNETTEEIVLEAACFSEASIRNTSKRLNLKSDSSLRFERGIDINRVLDGLNRATSLLIEFADAKVFKGISGYNKKLLPNEVKITLDYINDHLGTSIQEAELLDILFRLNYQVTIANKTYSLLVPSYRNDINNKEDILEEVARIYGFQNIKNEALPNISLGKLTNKQKNMRFIRSFLADLGLNEVVTYSLLNTNNVQMFADIGRLESVLLPLSDDKKTLRHSLINGLLDVISYNSARMQKDVFIFEMGNVFGDLEYQKLAMAITGNWHHSILNEKAFNADFFLLKGLFERLSSKLGIKVSFKSSDKYANLHKGKSAEIFIGDLSIGFIGTISPKISKRLEIAETVVLEINLEEFLSKQKEIGYEQVSKFPSITRDIAFVVDEAILISDLEDLIKQTAKNKLQKLSLFDIYRGKNLKEGTKSVAFKLEFNDFTKTMESGDVDKIMKSVINRLSFVFKASIRD